MNDESDAPGGAYREIIREQEERIDRLVFKLSQAQELITELCDALGRIPIGLTPPDRELVQRAREATSGR